MTRASPSTSQTQEGMMHVVQPGDCINSIAFNNGFFYQTLWDHADNADLKELRESPFMLLPGDVVHVPDLRLKDEDCATEQKHTFKRKGVPAEFEIILSEPAPAEGGSPPEYTQQTSGADAEYDVPEPAQTEMRPIKNAPYTLTVDGRILTGNTDANGKIKQTIPPNAREGILRIRPGTPEQLELTLTLGGLNPADTWSGMAQRLNNLGYKCDEVEADGPAQGAAPEEIAEQVRAFAIDRGLEPSGAVNDSLINSLKQAHGS